MSGLLGSLYVDVGINNKMGTEITSISSGLVALENKMKGVGGSLATSFDGAIGKLRQMPAEAKYLGAALSLGVTAPLTAFGVSAVKTFASFDDSMRQVQAVTGSTGSQFQELTSKAREMGETTSFTASQAAEAMTYLGMAGFKTDEIIGALPATLALARAGVLDLGTAADIMSNVMTIFGMQADEAGHAADVLAKVAHSTNTNVQQLGEAMTYAGPVASSFGLSMEQTAAAMGLLGNAGIQASMAGTTLRGILTDLVSPTKAARDTFAKYGITLDMINPKVHRLDEIFKTLKDSGMSSADMMEVFGLRAGPGMLALLNQGIDVLGAYSIELENVDGYAEQASITMDEGFGGAVRRMKSALESFSITIGGRLATVLTPFSILLKDTAAGFAQMNSVGQTAVVVLGGIVVALGPVLLGMAALPMLVDGIAVSMGYLGITTAGVTAALSSIVLPVAAVVAALYLIEERTGLVSKAFSFLYDVATVLWYDLEKVVKWAINSINALLDELVSMLSGGFLSGFAEAIEGMRPSFEKLTGWVSNAVDGVHNLADEYRNGATDIKNTTDDAGNAIEDTSRGAQDSYFRWGTYARDMATEVVDANQEVVESTQEAATEYQKAVAEMMDEVTQKTTAGIEFMSQRIRFDDLKKGIRTVHDELIILNDANELVKVSADGTVTKLEGMGAVTFETTRGGLTILTDGLTTAQEESGYLDKLINEMRNDVIVLDNTKLDNLQGEIQQADQDIQNVNSSTLTWEEALKRSTAYDFGFVQGEISDTRAEVDETTASTNMLNSGFINMNGLSFATIQANVSEVGQLTDEDTQKAETLNYTFTETNYTPFGTLFGNLSGVGVAVDDDNKKVKDVNSSFSTMGGFSFSSTISSLGGIGSKLDTVYEKAKKAVSELFKIGGSSGSSGGSLKPGIEKAGGSSGTGENNVKIVSNVNKNIINNNGDKLAASKLKASGG